MTTHRIALLLALAACESARTQVMIGVATDINAPNIIDGAQLRVIRAKDGFVEQQVSWTITGIADQPFNLPGSYGVYSDGEEVRLDLELTGLKGNTPVVARRAVMNLIEGRTLFFRMGLTAGCVDRTDCLPSQSCVEGACTGRAIESRRLPEFEPELVSELTCVGGANYIDTSTGAPMRLSDDAFSCPAGLCAEGTCLRPLVDEPVMPGADGGIEPDGDGGNQSLPPAFARWPLDGDAREAVGGLHGTVKGGTSTVGHDGSDAVSQGAVGDSIDLPTLPTFGPRFTVSMWAFWGSLPTYGDPDGARLISNENGAFFNGMFAITVPGGDRLQVLAGVDTSIRRVEIPAPEPNTWHHIAAVRDDFTLTLYLDGFPFASTDLPSSADVGMRPWHIGASPGSPSLGLIGILDEVMLFRDALTTVQIGQLASK